MNRKNELEKFDRMVSWSAGITIIVMVLILIFICLEI